MKERGTYLVADIYNDDYILAEYTRLGIPAEDHREGAPGGRQQRRELQEGGAGGVKIAFGTDAGVYPHGWNAKQFAPWCRGGRRRCRRSRQPRERGGPDRLGGPRGRAPSGKTRRRDRRVGDPLQDVTVLEHVDS